MTVVVANYDATISSLLTLSAPKRLAELENLNAPFLASMTKKPRKGLNVQKRIKSGQNNSLSWIGDGDTLLDGDTVKSETYTLLAKFLRGKLKIPRGAATQAMGDGAETANLLMEGLDTAAASAVQVLNQSTIVGGNIVITLNGTAGDGQLVDNCTTTTATGELAYDAATHLRVGQGLDVYQGANKRKSVYVASRTPDFLNDTYTLTFKDTGEITTAYTAADTDVMYMRGAYDKSITGIIDVADAASNLYGVTIATSGWAPSSMAGVGAASEAAFASAKVQVKNKAGNSGKIDAWLMPTQRLNQIRNTYASGKIVFTGSKVDIGDFETMDEVGGTPVVLDDNVPLDIAIGLNYGDFCLAEFQKMFQEGDGTPGQDKGKMHFKPSDTEFTYSAEFWGAYELEVDRRSSFIKLSGLTG